MSTNAFCWTPGPFVGHTADFNWALVGPIDCCSPMLTLGQREHVCFQMKYTTCNCVLAREVA
ncbi:hypothetical protein HYFRA_00011115 [Hymenoscyphus fraxineus]|uniref:Uncharacterized protein n=1 Tax=Hymenoscyphus fraxineus TaxID=746836 RepID=A0A9N9L5F1_9HELO|nr:hypothetical protein HYFRA_00011115 [Hymenoscyphus fraxineus]